MGPVLAGVLQLLALIAALALAYVPSATTWPGSTPPTSTGASRSGSTRASAPTPTPRCAGPRTCAASSPSRRSASSSSTCSSGSRACLPGSLGFSSIDPDQAFNTAASFVTNTNWQSYYGEQAMGHVVQTGGLAVQNFVSAAVGIAVAVALVRGFARSRTGELGNFWADLVRGVDPHPAAALRRRGDRPGGLRCHPELLRHPRGRPVHGRRRSSGTAARSPRRRPSRRSAPTAAATSTPTPPTPSRTRPRSPTSSRSSCCWSSRSR